jgi:hypothetical protein
MVVVNKDRILATCSFTELQPEQLKSVLSCLNAAFGLVELIIMRTVAPETWTANSSVPAATVFVLFRESDIGAHDLKRIPKVLDVHRSGGINRGGGRGSQVYMVLREPQAAPHPLTMPSFDTRYSQVSNI